MQKARQRVCGPVQVRVRFHQDMLSRAGVILIIHNQLAANRMISGSSEGRGGLCGADTADTDVGRLLLVAFGEHTARCSVCVGVMAYRRVMAAAARHSSVTETPEPPTSTHD
jgi:hypothetical protein